MIVEGDFIHVVFTAMAIIFALPAALCLALLVVGGVVDVMVTLVASLKN